MCRLKWSVEAVRNGIWGGEPDGGDDDILCVRVADFDRPRLSVKSTAATLRKVSLQERAGRVLALGDLLLEKSGGGEQQPVGFVVRYTHNTPAVCSNFIARLTASSIADCAYFLYVHAALYSIGLNRVAINQTTGIQNLDSEAYFNLLAPFPPLDEQRAIAEFLDRKTAEIDAVAAKKARLIELLRQERHATITRAATRGVNAAAPMKPSGLPWLGDVPQHWRLVQLKFVARIQTGVTLGKTYDEPTTHYPYLRVANVQDGSLVLDEITEIAVPRSEADRSMLRAGDVLLTEGGDLDKLGRGAVWRGQIENCLHQNHVFAVRPNPEVLLPEFLAYQTKAQHGREYFTLTGQKTTNLASTNTTKVGAFPLPLPTLAEQWAICDYIDRETGHIDGLIAKNEEQIAKLREYRHALISAAVTGKLAVTPQPAVVPKQVAAPQPAVAVPAAEPAKKPANAFFRRSVFAAEIIDRLHDEPTFGHVKFQKVFFVAQHHLQVGDFEENYHRQAAGPYDNSMIRSVDSQLEKQKWFAARHTDSRYVYEKLSKAGGHRQYFDRYFGEQAQALDEVVAIFRTMTTEQAEIVATLYAVWNDFLLLGEPFDDDRIIDDVLNNWHQSKQKISRDRWQKALGWMREKGLVPSGFGKPTCQSNTTATDGLAGEGSGPNKESED
jgi:type I restriction enzyme, S subunit